MKTNKTFYAIVMLLIVVALSVAVMPASAQGGWPEECELPDLEEAMSAANHAKEAWDVTGYLDALGDMANMTSNVRGSCLRAAVRVGVDLSEANLYGAHLRWQYLEEANLQGAGLAFANLQWADLRNANLQWAKLWEANLQGTSLAYVNLEGADLSHANLQGANLSGANLEGADLSGANLQEARLRHVNLLGAGLDDAMFGENTTLPDAEECQWDSQVVRLVCDSHWTPDTDMARFTDPEHPDFWDPCVELERTPSYCEDSDQ
jgi:uncharacterized protein YjbI with pentapeptide repeats